MPRFRVRVAQHRTLSVTVDAANGIDALMRGEDQVRRVRWAHDDYLGDEPFRVTASEAALIDEVAGEDACAGHASSADGRSSERPIALRQPSASREAGGARHIARSEERASCERPLGPPEIARRFGLAGLAVALVALHAPQARADISGAADEFIYSGDAFTTFQGGDACPHVCLLSGKVIISTNLAQYLDPSSGYANLIRVTQASFGLGVYMTDGAHHPPAIPPSFTFEAFLTPDQTAIDFSQGWSLSAAWNPGPSGYENRFLSVYAGSGGVFGATTDETLTLDASGVLTAEAFNTSAQGGWVDPTIAVPEASTWAMLIAGFLGMAPWAHRDPVVERALAIIRRPRR